MYAWALIRSMYRDDRLLGIQEFEGIRFWENMKLIFLDILNKYPARKRECYFFLASAYYKVGEFKSALKHVNDLLQIEPQNRQALDLKKKIEEKVTNGSSIHVFMNLLLLEGILGLALVGGIAAAAAGVALVFLRSKRK